MMGFPKLFWIRILRHLVFISVSVLLASACSDDTARTLSEPPELTFVGSDQCENCHEAQYADWQGSHHQLAMQTATADTVLGDFSDATFDYFGSISRFFRKDGRFYAETDNAAGAKQTFEITHTFGVTPLQQYLVDVPGGRKQALQIAWDSRSRDDGGQRWYHLYPDEHVNYEDPLHWTGRYFNWNYMCAECHSTNVSLGYDMDSDTFDTTYAEISVGCEACHGPGSLHVTQAHARNFDEQWGLAVNFRDRRSASWVMDVDSGIAQRSGPDLVGSEPEACGRCHSRRSVITSDYEHGRPLADTHMVALLYEHLYHADGRIQDEVYVYGSFVQSKMYAAGVSCSDCHEPHSGKLRTGSDPNAICSTCHLQARFASEKHAGVNSGRCVDCHMLDETYMGVDNRRDHSFRIPDAGKAPDHYGRVIAAGRAGDADDALLQGIANLSYPPIARATMLSLLKPLENSTGQSVLADQANDPDLLVRIGMLRALRAQSPEVVANTGTHLLRDPIRSVRVEAALTFVDYRDLLPLEDARAFASAAEEYRDSMLSAAAMPNAAVNLAEFENRLGNDAAAARLFEHAIRMGEDVAGVQNAYGLYKVRSGDPAAALSHLQRATELDPDTPWFAYVYGVALNSTGSPDEAMRVLGDAHDKFPENFDIGWALVTMYRDAGNRAKVEGLLIELQEQFPENEQLTALGESLLD